MNENGTEQIPNGNRQLTAINLTPSDPVLSVTGQGNKRSGSEETLRRLAKAEERKREVERKRAEKRELEARKKRELEERLRLEVRGCACDQRWSDCHGTAWTVGCPTLVNRLERWD